MSIFTQLGTFFKEIKSAKNSTLEKSELPNQEDLEFVTSANEAVLLNPTKSASLIVWMSFLLLAGLITWASIMPIDEVVKAQGSVIPSQQVQHLQSLEGGVLKELKVKEGEHVKKGDILAILDDSVLSAELTDTSNQKDALEARIIAINDHLADVEEIDFSHTQDLDIVVTAQATQRFYTELEENQSKLKELEYAIEQKREEYETAKSNLNLSQADYYAAAQQYKLNKKAFNEQVLPKVELLKSQQQLNDSKRKLEQAKNDLPRSKSAISEAVEHKNGYIHQWKSALSKEKTEILSKLENMKSKGEGLQSRSEYFVIKAPMNGIIKKINYYTIGSAIKASDDIMEIVPLDDNLIIEARVQPKDIGFIRNGLEAKVKLTAFDFARYGGLTGKVEYISADTMEDQKGKTFFIVRIRTLQNSIIDKKGEEHIIIPGMQTESNIVVDQKSILAYIFKQVIQ